MKQIFFSFRLIKLSIITLLLLPLITGCAKEKIKPRWKTIKIEKDLESLNSSIVSKVYITDENDFFAIVGSGYHEYYTSIYQSTDQGETWKNIMTDGGAFGFLYSSFYYDGTNLYVAGSGTIGSRLFMYDGSEITQYESPSDVFLSENTSLQFLTESTGYIAGKGFAKTTDGGITWSEQFIEEQMQGLYFSDVENGMLLSSNTLLSTLNGGNDWDTLFSGDSFNTLYMLNDLEGVIGGSKIWLTEDGGATWNEVYDSPVIDVCLNEEGYIYAVLENHEIRRSINKGSDWSKTSTKKSGFMSVASNRDYTIAGIKDTFDKKGKHVIMLLKN
ncbi:sialidase family protein [Crocinitomix algicola]|uniref:sialidase family protein n=1 Tax=Crocinitomix algicola TaxID=1740263 RepID=UPI001112D42B|nr:hypothetical protein [Crocinitomix algicola]